MVISSTMYEIPNAQLTDMRQLTENGLIFICDTCNKVIEGNVAAKIHYDKCTMHKDDSETEDLHVLSPDTHDEKELLIAEVFCREPLWNSLLPYAERNHNITSILWHEIDRALGVQSGYSQKTFKSLRDRFVKLLAEESKSKRNGSAASSQVNWKYFTQLNFLRPSVEYRPTTSNLSKSKRSRDMDTSEASCSSTPKKNKSVTGSLSEDFEFFYKKNLECNTVPDRIGSFILYLESEMRTLSNQAVKRLIRKITESLIQMNQPHSEKKLQTVSRPTIIIKN